MSRVERIPKVGSGPCTHQRHSNKREATVPDHEDATEDFQLCGFHVVIKIRTLGVCTQEQSESRL